MKEKTFKLGDVVTWESQARGWTRQKHGPIVEVVAPGVIPSIPSTLYTILGRRHESYVVAVEIGKRLRRTKLYWPRVSGLELA